MPSLLEIQQAICRSLTASDDSGIAPYVLGGEFGPDERLSIYRNTLIGSLTNALRLSFPAIHRLVGADFFESVARPFVEQHPPRSGYLDEYGSEFSAFLEGNAAVSSIPYVPGVARLEWAVNRAIHAPDVAGLDVARLAEIAASDHARIVFGPHPSIGLVYAAHPVDRTWRAVLDQDDDAMAAIKLDAGEVRLLIERLDTGVEITRLAEPEWHFMKALCDGLPLGPAVEASPEIDGPASLAAHLNAGRFSSIALSGDPD